MRQAGDDVTVAQEDLNASIASADATREAGRSAVAAAKADRARALRGLPTARRQVLLAERRLRVLTTPGDTSLQKLVSQAAKQEADGTARDVARLARKMGIQVPADEVLFFTTLPLRVDSVRVRRGDSVAGRVMTVSNSRLAIDSSLSPNDAKLVRPGATVKIEEPDLGVNATGVVTQVADRPGTHKVDPGRVYVSITPRTAPAQLVGASVKLTIAVKSTEQKVLTVPVTALSVGADGDARVQVQARGGGSQYVKVTPGLAAQGLVEVRPVSGELAAGDLVVSGTRDGSAGAARRTREPPAPRSRAARAPPPRARAGPREHRERRANQDLRERPGPRARRAAVGDLGRHDEQGNLTAGSRFERGDGQLRLRSPGHMITEPVPEPGTLAPAVTALDPWSPPEGAPPVVELRGVSRTYGSDPPVQALRSVDLAIHTGDWVAIVGPSGSGKSTLLNILGCLDRPTSGSYVIDGIDASVLSEDERASLRAQSIGFVFQTFHLLGHRTALENVMLADIYAAGDRSDRAARARAALERVKIGAPPGLPAHQALGRGAAAGGDRPGAAWLTATAPVRRAHRQPRHGQHRVGAGAVRRARE